MGIIVPDGTPKQDDEAKLSDEQAREPWRPEDGDRKCQECAGPNPVWFVDNAVWCEVVGTPDNPRADGLVLCPTCFALKVDVTWRLYVAGGEGRG